jgi:hypothetical protein
MAQPPEPSQLSVVERPMVTMVGFAEKLTSPQPGPSFVTSSGCTGQLGWMHLVLTSVRSISAVPI